MTLVAASPPSAPGGASGSSGTAMGAGGPANPRATSAGAGRELSRTALTILAMFLIGFVVWALFGSRLYYDRAQNDAYATFRVSLAQATAPIGPTQPFNPGQLLAPGTPVAVLDIPKIHLNAVVFEGTSGQVLEDGPGHLRDTPLPGQVGTSVIFGRHTAYGAPFSGLSALRVGDTFSTITGQGVSQYRVIDLRRAGDRVPPAPAAGQGRLILVTADGPALAPSGVLRIDADLISKANAAPPMLLFPADLSSAEQALGTDTAAWLPIVLWGVLLVSAVGVLSWLRHRWGRWQTWIVAVPVLCYLSLALADQVTLLLPNLL